MHIFCNSCCQWAWCAIDMRGSTDVPWRERITVWWRTWAREGEWTTQKLKQRAKGRGPGDGAEEASGRSLQPPGHHRVRSATDHAYRTHPRPHSYLQIPRVLESQGFHLYHGWKEIFIDSILQSFNTSHWWRCLLLKYVFFGRIQSVPQDADHITLHFREMKPHLESWRRVWKN